MRLTRLIVAVFALFLLQSCAYLEKSIDFAEEKIAPAGSVVISANSLIDLSGEFERGYVEFRQIIRNKKDDISGQDYLVLLEADRELSNLGAYVDGLLSTENSLGNVVLNANQISSMVAPVRNAVEFGQAVLVNNPQIFSDSEKQQYASLSGLWDAALKDVDSIDENLSESETTSRLLSLGRIGMKLVQLAPLLI